VIKKFTIMYTIIIIFNYN